MYGDIYISAGEGAAATGRLISQRIDEKDDLDFLLHGAMAARRC